MKAKFKVDDILEIHGDNDYWDGLKVRVTAVHTDGYPRYKFVVIEDNGKTKGTGLGREATYPENLLRAVPAVVVPVKVPETFDELVKAVTAIIPDAVVEEMYGQIVIWTGLKEETVTRLVPIDNN